MIFLPAVEIGEGQGLMRARRFVAVLGVAGAVVCAAPAFPAERPDIAAETIRLQAEALREDQRDLAAIEAWIDRELDRLTWLLAALLAFNAATIAALFYRRGRAPRAAPAHAHDSRPGFGPGARLSPRRVAGGLARGYRTAAIIAVNCALLFVAVNLAFYPLLPARRTHAEAVAQRGADHSYSIETLRRVYPGLSDAEIAARSKTPYGVGVLYEPFVLNRTEPGIASGGERIHETGFRFIGERQGPWPPDPAALTVFVFGGSTTIGIGVRDSETIPAFLDEILARRGAGRAVHVYNFGAPGYFSLVERVFFARLLKQGFVPDLAVFIDGYNDFHIWRGEPGMTWWFRDLFVKWQTAGTDRSLGFHAANLLEQLPFSRWLVGLRPRQTLATFGGPQFGGAGEPEAYLADPAKIEAVIARYVRNKALTEALAAAFGVTAAFVWQPVSTYKYDGALPLGPMGGEGLRTRWGYPAMRAQVERNPPGDNFIWCADAQAGIRDALYVDQAIHYNAAGGRVVARCIADALESRGLLAAAAKRGTSR